MASKVNPATGESQAETLKRLGAKRIPVAIDEIRKVGNLGSYKPTKEQTAKVFAELKKALAEAESLWSTGKAGKVGGFEL